MKTLFFSVNQKQKIFFENIQNVIQCDSTVISSKKLLVPSLKALKDMRKINLSAPITLKVKDFTAKYELSSFHFIIHLYATLEAYYAYFRYYRVIDDSYEQIMVWNGVLFRQAIALEIAKLHNLKILYSEIGLLPNRFTLDKKGVNFQNSIPRERKFYENYRNAKLLPNELIPRNPKNAKKFSNIEKNELPEHYIFIPFQVDYDTQILVNSPWIKDMRMLFDIIEKLAIEIPDLYFVFKEHPSSIKDYPDLHQKAKKQSNLLFANGHITQTLIENSQAVITINSTVGIEALLFYKKVIVLGNAFYTIDGITKWVSNESELIAVLKDLNYWETNTILIKNFLKYLYYDYLFDNDFASYNETQRARLKTLVKCSRG